MDAIRLKYNEVWAEIRAACQRSGRDPGTVKVVAVTKTQSVDRLKAAWEQGLELFGENRVQELLQKQEELPEEIKWHFIGTLQRNKVKFVVGRVTLIHSVESVKLAQAISAEAQSRGVVQDVLLQVNISGEKSKHGFTTEQILKEIKEISRLKGIRITGLMTIAPYSTEPESIREVFQKLRVLAKNIDELNLQGIIMKELSMGMSGDYATAVEEGATLIRVGSKIFGERNLF